MIDNQLIDIITKAVLNHVCLDTGENLTQPAEFNRLKIPVAISNRHVHLSEDHIGVLFGNNYNFKISKYLSQPGQFACEEKVTLVGPKGVIENVRILGPSRKQTQVELSISDSFKLGVKAPIRDSGDLANSAGITIVGPLGSITLHKGVIVAARHIHMHTNDALQFGVKDKDRVSVKVPGSRGLIFNEMLVRVNDKSKLEMHIDIDEANAAFLKNNDYIELINTQ
ncbi:phosphate propanoyltransferase [Desulfitobacterium sp. AusDCA]|uniref:phosphate propanoyltransferase n=1 Tax=Desulfitobacterium sp. AusDCA TaxID=3240383 RepID=UPI003DA7A136